jgi:hypothetical protein
MICSDAKMAKLAPAMIAEGAPDQAIAERLSGVR